MSLERTIEHLENLVAVESVSGSEAEAEPLDYVYRTLCSFGHVSIKHSSENGVIGKIEGSDPDSALMLQGHVDVVKPGSGWKTEPFELTNIDDDIFAGRGVSDMKGGIAQMLTTAETFERPRPSLIFEFVTGEEAGGHGTQALHGLNRDLAEVFSAQRRGALLLEPTMPTAENAKPFFGVSHRAALKCDVTIEGAGGHGAQDISNQTTAVGNLGKLHTGLELERKKWAEMYSNEGFGSPTVNITGELNTGEVSDNQIPERIEGMKLDIRYTPEMKPYLFGIIDSLQDRHDGINIEYDPNVELPDAIWCPPDVHIRSVLSRMYPEIRQTSFMGSTDMNDLQKAGWPTVISGPGDPNQMHKSNESIRTYVIGEHQKIINSVIGKFGRHI